MRLVRGGRGRLVTAVLPLLAVALVDITPAAAQSPQAATPASAPAASGDPAQYVNPFSGTDASAPDFGTGGGAANTFPGAVLPFGMTQWSPDTTPGTTNFAGGYTYSDPKIRGFSLTHLSGAGCAAYQDLPFMPTTGPIMSSPAQFGSSNVTYTAAFSHADEEAEPGYYRVRLNPGTAGAINSELTATTRGGAGRFTYPATSDANMIINAGGSAMADSYASVDIDPVHNEVSGSAASGHFCYQPDSYTVYFAAEFNRTFKSYGTWRRQVLEPGSTSNHDSTIFAYNYQPLPPGPKGLPGNPSGTAQAGGYVSFDTTREQVIEVRVGISFVSVEGARANLRAEAPTWDFDGVRSQARNAWNRMLSRIEVGGGSTADTRTFYTALYHALLYPSVFSDVNGQYTGMDGQVRQAQGYTQYANYSAWDTYRSQTQLLAMLAPHETGDMMQSLLADQRESGWLPKASLANGQADVMVGDSADPIIAGAYAFGATGFDHAAALQAMLKGATQYGVSANDSYVERQALAEYETLGYVPEEESQGPYATFFSTTFVWAAASTTLEYAVDDFALARFAAALGDSSTCQRFIQRSDHWRTLFNPATGYIEPRYASAGFDPTFNPTSGNGFAEGDGAQYSWMVPYNLAGLFDAMGGTARALSRLDSFFTRLNAGPNASNAFLGNEPTLETPWEYDWLGQPAKTQAVTRRAILTLYNATPGGYPGNDDLGQMSSWYVFAAVGFYPEVPGVDVLALGSPLFPQTTLHLAGGDVNINAPKASDGTPYVKSLNLNGRPYSHPWLTFHAIAGGATLSYDLGPAPTSWGSSSAAPPSFSGSGGSGCAEVVQPASTSAAPEPPQSGGSLSLPNTRSSPGPAWVLALVLIVCLGALAGCIAARVLRRRLRWR